MGASLEVEALDADVRLTEEQAQRARDLGPVLQRIARSVLVHTLSLVAGRRGPEGRSWPARKPATIRRHGNQSSGELEASLFARVTPDGIEYGATAPHAPLAQFGTRFMAPRRFGAVSDEGELQQADEALLEYVSTGG